MHIQIITFNLKDLKAAEFEKLCSNLSEQLSNIQGLQAKFWLTDSVKNTYCCIYLWEDKKAMFDFSRTELFNSIINSPYLINFNVNDYEVIEKPTRVNRGFFLEDYIERAKTLENYYPKYE